MTKGELIKALTEDCHGDEGDEVTIPFDGKLFRIIGLDYDYMTQSLGHNLRPSTRLILRWYEVGGGVT